MQALPFELPDTEGHLHTLADSRGRWLILTFHRHLGCPACRAHLKHLRQFKSKLDSLKVDVKIVTFDDHFLARAYMSEFGREWPLLIDAEQKLYQAYQLRRASWWTLLNPGSIFSYLKLIATGTRPGRPGRDYQQLGGDIIIDPAGVVRLLHISSSPHDRPQVADMLVVIQNSQAHEA